MEDEVSFPKIPPSEHYKLHNDKKEAVKHINLHETKKRIAYEDTQRLAFDKPAGFVIHGGTKQEHTTSLHDHLQQYVFLNKKNAKKTPVVVQEEA
jgi:23S rRNA-/tRNA-specific pseudouridylate synthase